MENEENSTENVGEEKNTEEADIYPTSTKEQRGLALIINVENFDGGLPQRVGSSVDVKKLQELWSGLRYKVSTCIDPTLEEMNDALDDFTSQSDHDDADSTVVTVMSHGKAGSMGTMLCTNDSQHMGAEEIIKKLDECPRLKEKPKFCIVETCRGGEDDDGNTTCDGDAAENEAPDEGTMENDGNDEQDGISPSQKDMLIVYATTPGNVAYLNSRHGSRLIESMCNVFEENVDRTDAVHLFQMTDDRLRKKSLKPDGSGRQTGEVIMRGFAKKFYFNGTPTAPSAQTSDDEDDDENDEDDDENDEDNDEQ